MKIKYKLSIMVFFIVALVAASISVLLLQQARNVALTANLRGIDYLANDQATYWKSRENTYIRVLSTLANVMGNFEDIPAEQRRDWYDDMLYFALESEPDMAAMYSIWKPNALDGMDSRFIGRTGSGPNGQYAMIFSKETGQIAGRSSTDIANTIAYLNGPNARKNRVDNPEPLRVNGKDTFAFRMMVPIINRRTNEIVGGLGCLWAIDGIMGTLDDLINTRDEVIGASIYSMDGTIIGDVYHEKLGKNTMEVDVEFGEHQRALYEAITNAKPFKVRLYDPEMRTNVVLITLPFQIGNSDQYWSILIGSPESFILNDVNDVTRYTIILASVAIILAALIVYIFLGKATKPIVTVADTLKDISEGEGDLTRTIAVSSNDEVGDLALYFNHTLEKIKNLVKNVKNEAAALSGIGNDLAGNMNQTATAVNEITANIQSMKGRVMNQSASVTETHATMEQVVAHIKNLDSLIAKQGDNISGTSSAIEQMVSNIHSVTETLVKNSGNVKNLREASEVGRLGLQEVSGDIQEIARESEGLLEINAVMENIASQTNLLSMNAAIEAAHAGESGKGFAVVADEIRKLAENSSEQSKTISAVLKKIKGSIDKITQSTENVLNKFEAIDSNVKIVAQQEDVILNAMEEQGEGSKQILKSSSDLDAISRLVQNGSDEIEQGVKEVIKESDNLERATQEITSGMNEMSSGADQINVAVNHVNGISGRNREGIDTLICEVSRFKVE
jgi:methyl-accepting chemotaxis protein